MLSFALKNYAIKHICIAPKPTKRAIIIVQALCNAGHAPDRLRHLDVRGEAVARRPCWALTQPIRAEKLKVGKNTTFMASPGGVAVGKSSLLEKKYTAGVMILDKKIFIS